jgi:hypothetical protein
VEASEIIVKIERANSRRYRELEKMLEDRLHKLRRDVYGRIRDARVDGNAPVSAPGRNV